MNDLGSKKQKRLSFKKIVKSLPYEAIVAFLLASIALVFGLYYIYNDSILSRVSTATYPVDAMYGNFAPGTVVSLNDEGKLIKQSGTTVYKNRHVFKTTMLNAQAVSLADDILVIVYHGKLTAIKLGDKNQVIVEKEVELPRVQIGKQRQIDCAVRVPNTNQILIVGSSEVVTAVVVYENHDFQITFGEAQEYYFSPLELHPKVSVSNNRLAILFTDNDYSIRLVTATVDLETHSVDITSSDVITESASVYAIAYICPSMIAIGYSNSSLIQTVVGIEERTASGQYVLSFEESIPIDCAHIVSFLDMGSWNHFVEDNHNIIIAYITEDEGDGLIIRHLQMTNSTLRLGTRMNNKNSGVSDIDVYGVHHLSLLMLHHSKFLVYYSSIINNGYTALQVGYLTPSLELIGDGPQFIVSRGVSDINKEYYYVSASESGHRILLVESLYRYLSVDTSISYVDIYNRPLGIVSSSRNGYATVVTQGVYQIPFALGTVTPLKYYYSNSKGEYISGEWIGMRGMESYYVYIENDEVKMLTDTRNRIGYSISNLQMMVQLK